MLQHLPAGLQNLRRVAKREKRERRRAKANFSQRRKDEFFFTPIRKHAVYQRCAKKEKRGDTISSTHTENLRHTYIPPETVFVDVCVPLIAIGLCERIFAYLPYAVHYTATCPMTCCIRKSWENFENRSMRSVSLFIGQVETGIPCRCTGARRNALISEEIRNLLRSTSNHASHIRPIYISDSLLGKNCRFENRITHDFVAAERYKWRSITIEFLSVRERKEATGMRSSERLFLRSKMKDVRCFVTFDPASTLSTPLIFDDTDTFDNFQS
ncbi:PREDICTED: uncharacterized protein LOC108551816 [Eufriesea mexicana]|uniref:uncharacterized protein LOC108551816 n=1 Tax=Eufriesea mexicana TaxID=516756 RepID=UPI00083BD0DA|nr:PREDICTED: uncharacterized protein LOC108551816 [Eufriesea mexicana]